MGPIQGNLLTMLGVMVGWVLFRAKTFDGALTMYGGMLGLHGGGISDELAWQATPDRLWFILIALGFVYLPLLWHRRSGAAVDLIGGPRLKWASSLPTLGSIAAFALGIVLLYSRDAVPFLYFQF